MTPKQYEAAIGALGLSQRSSARWLEVDERQVRRWIAGEARIPGATAKLLRLCVKMKLKPEDVK